MSSESMESLLCAVSMSRHVADDSSPPVQLEEYPVRTDIPVECDLEADLTMEQSNQNLWHRDYTSQPFVFRSSNNRDKLYTFLVSSSLSELRSMGRETSTKHTGVKNAVICHRLLNGQKYRSC